MNKEDLMKELEKRLKKAKDFLSDEDKTREFMDDIEGRYNDSIRNKNPLFFVKRIRELKTYIPLFVSLVRSYIKKEYRQIPFMSIVTIVAALIYFLSPLDVIPDFIPGLGFVDDATIIAFCFMSFKHDLDKYSNWLKNNDVIDVEARPISSEQNV